MKNTKKFTLLLLLISVFISLFTGCGSQSSAGSSASQHSAVQGQRGNRQFNPTAMKESYEPALKELVSAGTITQAQADKVLAELTNSSPQAGNQGNQGQGTAKNGPNNRRGGFNRFGALVSSGVITQAQADAINAKVMELSMKSRYEPVLKELVTAGTITQDQADKVLAELTKSMPQQGAPNRNNNQQNNNQGQQGGNGNGQNNAGFNRLSGLVSSGVITQAQADAINEKMRGTQGGFQNRRNNQPNQN
jgi:polyhydroxyalkanoate synthesis regulator phasin